jgi:hypothetical protein
VKAADAVISLSEPEENVEEAFAAQLRKQGVDGIIDYL